MLLNCGVGEDSWESLGQQGDTTSFHLKEDESWIFTGRTDVEAETPILWPPDAKSWLIWKDPDAGKDWRREEKGMTEEMVGWHHWLNGHQFEQIPGDGEGQGGLVYSSSWDCKESDTTKQLNNTVLKLWGCFFPIDIWSKSICSSHSPKLFSFSEKATSCKGFHKEIGPRKTKVLRKCPSNLQKRPHFTQLFRKTWMKYDIRVEATRLG